MGRGSQERWAVGSLYMLQVMITAEGRYDRCQTSIIGFVENVDKWLVTNVIVAVSRRLGRSPGERLEITSALRLVLARQSGKGQKLEDKFIKVIDINFMCIKSLPSSHRHQVIGIKSWASRLGITPQRLRRVQPALGPDVLSQDRTASRHPLSNHYISLHSLHPETLFTPGEPIPAPTQLIPVQPPRNFIDRPIQTFFQTRAGEG